MSERVQPFLLYPCCRKYPVITLAEIHRPSVIAMFIRHQGPFLSEVCFLPQVLDHGDCCVVEWHTSLTSGGLQLAHFHISSRLGLQAVPPPHLFYATLKVEDTML